MYEIYQGISHPGCIPAYPGYGYMNRDLWQTITSSHLTLQTKQGRIKNFKLSGVTRQVETTGAQLLDVNQIPKGTEGGATLDIVDDQIIISGSGALTSTFGRSKKLTHEETMQLIGDNRTFTLSVTQYTNPPAFVNFADASKNLMTLSTLTATSITRTIPENMDMDTLYITYGVYNIAGADIVPGAARVMLNAGDTALPWEPYTGTQSSPSPEYTQDIQGVGVRTAQMLDFTKVITYGWCALVDADTGTIKCDIVNDYYCVLKITYLNDYIMAHKGGNLTFYADQPLDTWLSIIIDGTRSSGKTYQEATGKGKIVKATIADDFTSVRFMELRLNRKSSAFTDTDTVIPNIMLCEGTAVLPYEPYGYRTDVEVRSKNLADISGVRPSGGTIPYQQIPDGFILDSSDINHRISWIPCELKSGVKYAYRFRCKYSGPEYLMYTYLPQTSQFFTPTRDGDIITGTFIPSADASNFGIYRKEEAVGSGAEAEITELQVEEGSTPTPYQPYAYYTAPIYTREPVYQGDKIQLVDGQYCHISSNIKYVFTGNEMPVLSISDYGHIFTFSIPGAMYEPGKICARSNCFVGVDFENRTNSGYERTYVDYAGNVVLRNSAAQEFPNVQAMQDFLKARYDAGNPVYVVFAAEPQTEPLPAISQQALRNLPTYKGTTIIDTTDPLEPEITVSYRPQTDYSKLPGLEADYEKGIFTRLGAAKNLTAGTQFNRFPMYAGRRRCNVLDDGTITAYYGDPDYKEDGSNGQVMVYQPKFYYQVVPLKTDPQTDGIGYHLRRAQYWVSPKPQPEFKLHPAFINASGQEVDHILLSAYESSLYDTSEATYILDDAQVMDVAADKLSSIAGAKPASGKTQQLTRVNAEKLAQNRGSGWHGDTIKAESANQLLMIIEQGTMNIQAAIGNGVVAIPDTQSTENNSIVTGGTSNLGSTTGMANGDNGKVSVSYRGMENPWGNIWKFVYGVNIWGDGTKKGGVPYICTDFNYAESKNSENYESAGFTLSNENGYISAMGYSEAFDWLFMPSETVGNSSLPVGDYLYITPNLNDYRIALLGGPWCNGGSTGGFCWLMYAGVNYRLRAAGSRLIYVPTDNLFNINRVFANPVPEATGYYKFDLGLSPGNYRWSIQKNEFLGSGQYVLFTNDLGYGGSGIDSAKIYDWIGHSTRELYCHTSGAFTVTNEMYIASLDDTNIEKLKQLLKTLRIEKA